MVYLIIEWNKYDNVFMNNKYVEYCDMREQLWVSSSKSR